MRVSILSAKLINLSANICHQMMLCMGDELYLEVSRMRSVYGNIWKLSAWENKEQNLLVTLQNLFKEEIRASY